MTSQSIAFIGSGNMAQSLIKGFYHAGYQKITVSSPSACDKTFLQPYAKLMNDNIQAIKKQSLVVLAVKPHQIMSICQEIAPNIEKNTVILSVAAGISAASIAGCFSESTPIVRAMPNTPVEVSAGVTGLFANNWVTPTQKKWIGTLFSHLGFAPWVEQESKLHAITAIAGSGPAYFYLFMEALEKAAITIGLDKKLAYELSLQTNLGAAKLASHNKLPFKELRAAITSKGGTTEAATNTLIKNQLDDIVNQAVNAALSHSKMIEKNLKP